MLSSIFFFIFLLGSPWYAFTNTNTDISRTTFPSVLEKLSQTLNILIVSLVLNISQLIRPEMWIILMSPGFQIVWFFGKKFHWQDLIMSWGLPANTFSNNYCPSQVYKLSSTPSWWPWYRWLTSCSSYVSSLLFMPSLGSNYSPAFFIKRVLTKSQVSFFYPFISKIKKTF